MFIPIEFQKVRDKTTQPFIRIQPRFTDQPASVLASKFGGTPYGKTYPVDAEGDDMALLAQINFAEIAPFDNDNVLPTSGILQIFLPQNDDLYGADFEPPEDSEADFAVRFIEDVPESEEQATFALLDEDALFPVNGEHLLTFSTDKGFAGMTAIESQLTLGKHPFEVLEEVSLDENEENQFYENVEASAKSQGHKLLGHPYFTQTDPRENGDYRLLLQIDTDMIDDNDIMWGDSGVAQFFIRDEDLAKRDFSALWFNWDCF